MCPVTSSLSGYKKVSAVPLSPKTVYDMSCVHAKSVSTCVCVCVCVSVCDST